MSLPLTVAAADAGKLLLRLALGILVLLHGIAKVIGGPAYVVGLVEQVGLPGSLGYAVYLGEVVAPLALIVGVWTRLAALIVAANMAVVRHFALNLVRQAKDKRAIKRRRKMAAWDPKYLAEVLGAPAR